MGVQVKEPFCFWSILGPFFYIKFPSGNPIDNYYRVQWPFLLGYLAFQAFFFGSLPIFCIGDYTKNLHMMVVVVNCSAVGVVPETPESKSAPYWSHFHFEFDFRLFSNGSRINVDVETSSVL